MSFEVESPILNSPFVEPGDHWFIRPGEPPQKRSGRRPALVFQPRDQTEAWDINSDPTLGKLDEYERAYALRLVNLVRERLVRWQADGRPGATRTTLELIGWWRREGRAQRLFFAQLEAVSHCEERSDEAILPPSDWGWQVARQGWKIASSRHALLAMTKRRATPLLAMTEAASLR